MSGSLLTNLPDVRDAMRTAGALPAVGGAIVAAALAIDARGRARSRTRPTTNRTEVSR